MRGRPGEPTVDSLRPHLLTEKEKAVKKRPVSTGRIVTAGVVSILLSMSPANAGELDPNLERILMETPADDIVSVLVWLQDRVNIVAVNHDLNVRRVPLAERHEFVVRSLQEKAAATQGEIDLYLNELLAQGRIDGFRMLWIDNVIRLDAVPAEIEAIAARPDVERVHFNYPIELIEPDAGGRGDPPAEGGVEPGVAAVRAPEVWAMGITGTGVLVASLDTGVDGNHPALASRWRGLDPAYLGNPGWAWFDPVTGTSFPESFGSIHGTHTMGSVCGGAPGDQVGVAPGAQWIHAAVIDRVSLSQTIADALLAFQWVIDPDGNPATDFDVPDVCSNSWGLATFHGVPECDDFFWSALDACEAAGIVIIFAAGNEGSNGLRRPADRGTDDYRTFAVGGVNANVGGWPPYSNSSTGPTDCGPDGESVTKPEIAAPAVSVRSSVPGGGYGLLTGTSMAAPHVNGVVALMRQANPDLSTDDIKQIIYDTAFDLGMEGDDNQFGWGMIDAFEAVQQSTAINLAFLFPLGRPSVIDPAGGTVILVVVTGSATLEPDSGTLYVSTGGPFSPIPMVETAPGAFNAVFPAVKCLAEVEYYFSVGVLDGETAFNPFDAPNSTYAADAYSGTEVTFVDTFSTDTGWSVTDSPGLRTGTWERGIPIGGGDAGDPPNDADGSGFCYVTQNVDGNFDVDGGTTTLTSPTLDASDPDANISYIRWYSNGTNPQDDVFVVEASDDDGATWVNLETLGPTGPGVDGGWIQVAFLISEIPGMTNTNQFRLRFHASDEGALDIVEAGVDLVRVFKRFCDDLDCAADLDGDGTVGINDFLILLAAWGPNPGHPADLDGDGTVGINDFLSLLEQWGACP